MAKRNRMDTDPLAVAIGTRIRKLRVERKLEGRRLAEMLGVPSTQITAWEHGRVAPGSRSLLALARALNTTADAFLSIVMLTDQRGYEVIQVGKGGATAGNHFPGVTGIRFATKKEALLAAAQACGESQTWRVVEIPPGEPLDYDGHVVAEVTIARIM